MATIDVQVGAGADDGSIRVGTALPDFYSTAQQTSAGKSGTGNDSLWESWYRFTGVSGLSGATINVSYISLWGADTGNGGTGLSKIYCEDATAPAAPTSKANFQGKTLTTASIDWDGTCTANAWNDSPSINSVIQELADSYNPSVIQIMHKDDGSVDGTTNRFRADTYDLVTTDAAKLHIEYTAGGVTFVPRLMIV